MLTALVASGALGWIHDHQMATGFIALWIFSVVASHLPAPTPQQKTYGAIYTVVHFVAGNLPQFLGNLFPQYAAFIYKVFGVQLVASTNGSGAPK